MTITTAGLGLLGKLITSGLQRAGSLVFQKLTRIARIEAAIRVGYQRNPSIKKAVDDLETVFGNRFGKLTEKLHQFLEELERSGVINAMVENALLDRSSQPTKAAFESIFVRAFGDLSDAELLFNQMALSFSITLRELSKDGILVDALRLVSKDIGLRLDQVDRALSEMRVVEKKKRLPSLETLQPNLLKLAKGLQTIYKQIRVETNKGARQVDISRIYIPSKLRYRDTKKNTNLIASAHRILTKEEGSSSRGHVAFFNPQSELVPVVRTESPRR
jgi:hypothetical protein